MRKLRCDGRTIDISARLGTLRARLAGVPGLVAVYLHGSYGTPFQTPLSDVDLAVVYRRGAVPTSHQELDVINSVIEALGQEDVSVTTLNRSPVVFQFRVLETGRPLLVTDETALADFVEEVLGRHGDFIVDYRNFLGEYDQALVEHYGGSDGRG